MSYIADLQNEVMIKNENLEWVRYRNYKAVGLTFPHLSIKRLIEAIQPKSIIDIIKLLLLEKKIILIRDSCSDNAILFETLLMLISPLYFSLL